MKILAFIPARGGSKGLKHKNILPVDGKPLIAYAIECALDSAYSLTVVVNSDSDAILNVASEYPEVLQQKRGLELAMDDTPITDVLTDALFRLDEEFDIIILLQPTSPIRSGEDIDRIIPMFEDAKIEGVVSVVPMDDMHPARMYQLEDSGVLDPYESENEFKRRQDLIPVYYRNGCFYAVRTRSFFEQQALIPKVKKAYVMNPNHLANIDSPRDFLVAEALVKEWKAGLH